MEGQALPRTRRMAPSGGYDASNLWGFQVAFRRGSGFSRGRFPLAPGFQACEIAGFPLASCILLCGERQYLCGTGPFDISNFKSQISNLKC